MDQYRRGFYLNVVTGRDPGQGPSRRGGVFGGSGLEGFSGVGVGGFRRAYADAAHLKGKEPKAAASHTTPVTVAAETGLPGLLLFFWLIGTALWLALRRRPAGFDGAARLAFGLALTAILVHCVFYNALFEDPTFYGLLALVAIAARTRQEPAS